MNNTAFVMRRAALVAVMLGATGAAAWAQTNKSVTIEPTQLFQSFNQWLSGHLYNEPAGVRLDPVVQAMPMRIAAPPQGTAPTYEPQPVISGLPDLPLVGATTEEVARNWGPRLNYQAMHMKLIVLSADGVTREFRPLSAPLKVGERFKLRLAPTFDSVASVDQVVGDLWYGQRTGQVYPQSGMSVQINAGETVDLPLGPTEYFVMDTRGIERFVVAVRHARAIGAARSSQPVYRQNVAGGSNYLQLVPRDSFPAFEQLIIYSR